MINNTKVILTRLGELELSQDTNIPLNWNLNDLRDMTTRGGAYSKTIILPGSQHNTDILKDVFNVNAESLTFNPLIKEPVIVQVGGSEIIRGVFQLRKIRQKYLEGDNIISYEAVIRNDTTDIYTVLNAKYLQDLDLSQYSHRINREVVAQSMRQGNFLDGYQYWLAYKEPGEWQGQVYHVYEARDLKPATYVKTIFDAMFTEVGYTYEFPELYELNIDKLIIPFSGEQLSGALQQTPFKAGITQALTFGRIARLYCARPEEFLNLPTPIGEVYQPFNPGYVYYEPDLHLTPWENQMTTQTIVYESDDDVSNGLFDPSDDYSVVTGEYTLRPETTSIYLESVFRIGCQFVARYLPEPNRQFVYNGLGGNPDIDEAARLLRIGDTFADDTFNIDLTEWSGNAENASIHCNIYTVLRAYDINGVMLGIINEKYNGRFSISVNDRFDINTPTALGSLQCDISGTFVRGQFPTAVKVKVTVEGRLESEGNSLGRMYGLWGKIDGFVPPAPWFGGGATFLDGEWNIFTDITSPLGYFKNNVAGDLKDGDLIELNKALPAEIKQSDFLIGLCRLFNLMIIDDPENDKNVIFKTRDRFYLDGPELDWNHKLDKKSIDIELLSNTQQKVNKFAYSTDDDDVNSAYEDKTKQVFGQQEYIFLNEFINGEESIEPIFSPTPMVWQESKNIPYIDARAPENNIRILYVGDYFDVPENWYYRFVNDDIGVVLQTVARSEYRYVGHVYPNAYEPTEDLNFGVCQFYAHNYNTVTNNNLFNRFYRNQMKVLETGHMMTANFYLTPEDIENLDLASRIYVNGSWWNINRIIDYNPVRNSLTKVELVTASDDLSPFVPDNNLFIQKRWQQSEGFFGQFNSKNNTTMKMGDGNFTDNGKSGIIIGDENTYSGSKGLIVGDNNKVSGNKVIALGVDGMTITEPGVYLGNVKQVVHFIDGGRDEVLGIYPSGNMINCVDGGTDEIRPKGGYGLPDNVDGGRDRK